MTEKADEDTTSEEQLRWAGLQLERLGAEQSIVLVSGKGERPGQAARALRAAAAEQGLDQVAIVEVPGRDRFAVERIELPVELKGARRQFLLGRARTQGVRDGAQETLQEVVAFLGRSSDVGVAVVPFGVALDQVSEDVMRDYGWVRAEEAD